MARTAPVTILIVEDDPDIATLLEYRLRKEGFSVQSVDRGDKVLATVDSCMPDLIVLDLALPGFSGVEVCRALRHHPRASETPILVVTASADEEEHRAALAAGASRLLVKRGFLKAVDGAVTALLPPL